MRRLGFLFGPVLASFLALAFVAQPARADIAYSCGTGCNGNEYAVWLVSQSESTYVLQLDIKVTADYTGNQWTDVVNAVGLKNFTASSFTNFSLLDAPGGTDKWDLALPGELNATGCREKEELDEFRFCAEADSTASYTGASFSSGVVLSWRFQFDSLFGLNPTAHIKYLYNDSAGKKVGDLGSWDTPIQHVPEPASILGLGTFLFLIGSKLRRKRA